MTTGLFLKKFNEIFCSDVTIKIKQGFFFICINQITFIKLLAQSQIDGIKVGRLCCISGKGNMIVSLHLFSSCSELFSSIYLSIYLL